MEMMNEATNEHTVFIVSRKQVASRLGDLEKNIAKN